MDLEKLQTLKEMILDADDFGDCWDYFLDHFGESRQFVSLGKPTRNKLLESVVKKLALELYPDNPAVAVLKPRLVRLRKHRFLHGTFFIEGRLGAMIFFEDADVGLMSLTPTSPEDATLFMRFSAYQGSADKGFYLTPKTAKEIN